MAGSRHYGITVYPNNGNIFAVVGAARRGMREAGASQEEPIAFSEYVTGAQSYDEALARISEYVDLDVA